VSTSKEQVIETVEGALREGGIHSALAVLNGRTSHRFTGLYGLEPPMLRNLRLFDQENPELEVGADSPLRETYCSITGGTGAPFAAADTGQDERLLAHPARESTLAYCGVPLIDGSGAVLGTLCHFDLVPRPVQEIEVLEAVAPVLLDALLAEGLFPAPS
jgi:GAF domain-containing protein